MKFSLQPDFQLQSLQKLAEVKYTVVLLCINEITAKKKLQVHKTLIVKIVIRNYMVCQYWKSGMLW